MSTRLTWGGRSLERNSQTVRSSSSCWLHTELVLSPLGSPFSSGSEAARRPFLCSPDEADVQSARI